MRKIAISLTILFIIIIYSCSLFLPDEDKTGPVIVLDSPSTSDIVSETVLVSCTATDDEGVAGTELFIDHQATGLIDTTAPYSFDWNTLDYEDGSSHIIYVQGWDVNDNYANSDTILVVVDNATVHPAPIENMNITYQPIGYLISWNMTAHEKFAAYTLQRSEKANMDSSSVLFTSTVAEDTTFFDAQANPLLTYFYQVQITDSLDFISIGSIVISPSSSVYAPSGLTATAGDTTILLRWNDNSDFESSIRIQRDAGDGYIDLDTVVANSTSYLDLQLEYDKQYRYTVLIEYAGATSDFSNIASVFSPLRFAPTNLRALATIRTIQLSWDDNCNFEEGYILERNSGLGYVPIAELGSNATSFEDEELAWNIYYHYRVRAFTDSLSSNYSTSYSISSPLEYAPTNLALVTNDTSIILTWEDRSFFEDGFIIQRSETSSSGYVTLDSVESDSITYTDYDLDEDTYYWYRIAAYTSGLDHSSWTFSASIWSPIEFKPVGLSSTSTDTAIQLRWTDNCIFEDGFVIERDAGNEFVVIAEVDANTTGYLDTDMVFGVTYIYRVYATDGAQHSEYSNTSYEDSPLRFAPTGAYAIQTGDSIQILWIDNCIFEDGFTVERNMGGDYSVVAELSPNTVSYVDSDMNYDARYIYRISARSNSGRSSYSYSNYVSSPLEYAPTNLALVSNDTSITLSWEDRSNFETGFIIQRSESSASGYITIDSVETDSIHYIDYELEENKYYWYRVAAYAPPLDRSNYTYSASISSPIVFTPRNLSATTIDTAIQLRWTDNCVFEDGFILERDSGSGYTILTQLNENVTGYRDADMDYGVVYSYRVAAFDGEDQSDYTSAVTMTSPLQFAPTNLIGIWSGNSIQLRWNDNCIFEDGYTLERDMGAGFVLLANLAPNTSSFLDTDMDFDAIYSYRISAIAGSDNSTYAYANSVQSPLVFAPTGLNATTNDTSITLAWADSCVFEEGFRIERNDGTGFIVIGDIGSNITTYLDTDMSEGPTYEYRVAAYTSEIQSAYSPSIQVNSPIRFAPLFLTASTFSNQINLGWFDNCTFEDGFTIERDEGAGFVVLAQVDENVTSYSDVNMAYAVEYSYRISAYNGSDQSAYTNIAYATSPLQFTPSGLFAYVTGATIDLSWQDNCIFEDGFHVERDAGSGFEALIDVAADVTSYSDADLVEGVTYRYRVSAFTATLESDYSSIISVESPIAFAPVNLQAVTQNTSIDLSWTDNCSFEDGFIVERDAGAGFVEIADLSANFTFYSDEDLEYYTIYRYRVAAYTTTEQSNFTPIITVQSPIEIAPSALVATSFDTEILLEWQDDSNAEEGFRVYRATDGAGFDYNSPLVELSADVNEYTDYAVEYGTEYSYIVSAFANGQESAFTNEATGSIAWLYTEWETIDAGTYTLGHASVPSGVFEHTVPADFEMMRYEVTNIQYTAFMEEAYVAGEIFPIADASGFENSGGDLVYDLNMTGSHIVWDGSAFTIEEGYALHPVVGVTWFGADAFASFYNWSLPSEAEWEVAARADTEFDYPWNNTDPTCEQANFSGCSAELLPVGQTTGVSPFGIYDMVGNAWEWTDSFFDGANDTYVLRGGSWSNYTDNLKVWYRTEGLPTAAYNTIGFRCVR